MPTLNGHSQEEHRIAYLIHHLILPPKVPQSHDFHPENEKLLLDTTIQALQSFQNAANTEDRQQVAHVLSTVKNLALSRDVNGFVSEDELSTLFDNLITEASEGAIPLEIKAQNAGILVEKVGNAITFECFELSPSNGPVIATKGRLNRTFPATATTLSMGRFQEGGLRNTLAQTIAKMSMQSAPGFQPVVRKAKQDHEEMRDTTHPGLVTKYLVNVLTALGEPSNVPGILKNTREEVAWSNSSQPWQRSSLWLLLRVSMQLQFRPSKNLYKSFMIFMLSQVLDLARQHHKTLGSEVLFTISAKLSRRIIKLETLQPTLCSLGWMTQVREAMLNAHDLVESTWNNIMDKPKSHVDAATLQNLRPENDLNVDLPDLDAFIARIAARKQNTITSSFRPMSTYPEFPAHELPSNFRADGEYQYFKLTAVEKWVENHLPAWLDRHISDEKTCGKLRQLIHSYQVTAKYTFSGIPVSMSIMYLTIMELWVACDKSACRVHPLLKGYDPEIPVEQLQSLLLPRKCQLQRLSNIEVYLQSRKNMVTNNAPSFFRDFGHGASFAVKFFDQSMAHQNLLSHIEQVATVKREAKCEELSRKQEQYRSLMDQADRITCEYRIVLTSDGDEVSQHAPNCHKCSLQAQARAIDIRIYEWPLSSKTSVAKATVFELMAPEAFSNWRDATVFLLSNVFESKYQEQHQPRSRNTLDEDNGLSPFLSQDNYVAQRIVLLSEVKPHMITHRHTKKIPTLREEDVCLNNGLQYAYFDTTNDVFSAVTSPTDKMLQQCTYQLPTRSSRLQKYLVRSPSNPHGVPPNEVIADQSQCPAHMSLDEYKAFGALPLGFNIQYMNILTQLAVPAVDFAKAETQALILQTIHQASCPSPEGNVERAGHHVLADDGFGNAMIQQLEVALRRIRENWESWRTLATFIQLATRLLTFATSQDVQSRCLQYLEGTREVSLGWLSILKERAHASTDDGQRTDLHSRAVEIALVCISTFDVDQNYLDQILSHPSAALVLIRCSIVVEENKYSSSSEYETMYRAMLQSWRTLSYRAFSTLKNEIDAQGSPCLNNAVSVSWAAFRAAGSWNSLPSPRHHWLVTKSISKNNPVPLPVHFNLLTAELLVNGLPLARLPGDYMEHPTYAELFRKVTLEVVPTNVPGLSFSAKHKYRGYELYFGIQAPEMLVQARKDGQYFELLPKRVFNGHFPTSFVEDFVHWYDCNNDEIEFRPRGDQWTSSPNHWRLCRPGGGSWRMRWSGVDSASSVEHPSQISWQDVDGFTLVNMNSNTARELTKILSPLENNRHVHILFNNLSKALDIELPRLQLGFYFDHGGSHIYSRQHPGMVIDQDQGIGTLIGLSSKLVLKHEQQTEDRLVLVPEGLVKYEKTSNHIHVTIDEGTVVKVHAYPLDITLRRLVDNGSLQSKLFICYVHALTSYCLPDPLTGKTGTETALSILESAAVQSFDILTQENISTLVHIAKLAPGRSFYPKKERLMQEVEWDPVLHPLSQDSNLYTAVENLFEQSQKQSLFYSSDVYIEPSKLNSIEPHLLQRHLIRTSMFRVSGFGAENHSIQFDRVYQSRDREKNCERAHQAFAAARLIIRDQAALHVAPASPTKLLEILKSDYFHDATVKGPRHLGSSSLVFDSQWLHSPSTFLPDLWCSLHSSLATSPNKFNKYHVMMWLSTLAFAEKADMNIIQALAAFYRLPDLGLLGIPSTAEMNLSKGDSATVPKIKDLVKVGSVLKPFHVCPEASLPKQSYESHRQCQGRRQKAFRSNQSNAIDFFARELERQWPCERPKTPTDHESTTYLDITMAMARVSHMFKTWYENRQFYQYLEEVSAVLANQQVVRVSISQPRVIVVVPGPIPSKNARFFGVDDVLALPIPISLPRTPQPLLLPLEKQAPSTETAQTKGLLAVLCEDLQGQAKSKREKEYVLDLRKSFVALENYATPPPTISKGGSIDELLKKYLADCKAYFEGLNLTLQNSMTAAGPSSQEIAACIQQAPRVSPTFWLRQLNRSRWDTLSKRWKNIIIQYGLAVTELHRAQRLFALSNKPLELVEELRNSGHQNWDPAAFPESLLLEAESGIMIREVQEEIAEQMRSPPNGENSVMQLNMGEGKSSVIVPIVAAALADGSRLVRVVVAKPQSKQMFQMLVSKLGGLLNRRIYHMPFSRELRLSTGQAEAIGKIYQDCMEHRGILLVQPEHILSFKLMGLETLLTDQKATASSLLSTQHFFDTKSRDIVDESDENFSVKFELIYTMGTQRSTEFSPDRWNIIHTILELVSQSAKKVKSVLPASIEVDNRWEGRFPRVRTLRDDANEMLLHHLAENICRVGFLGFPVARQPKLVRDAVFRYITEPQPSSETIDVVEKGDFWTPLTENPLLLVRGLIAGGILRFALASKRWRVNFGIDPTRNPKTKLAVPFRSKDSPSPRSEFSHPDVIIVLTSLTYYYGGLDDEDLFDTFTHLLKSDQADIEYGDWVRTANPNLPEGFRQLAGINIKDRFQCIDEIFPALRFSKGAIDYFLSRLVFPKEMKEFPLKLSASGWDIGQVKSHPTTGFSGTCDSRHVIPLSVNHLDLDMQRHTNALVLAHLLQAENSVEILSPRASSVGSDAEHLLRIVNNMTPPTRVILDVGAQILELNNREVAEKWLDVNKNGAIKAAVFFNDDEELSVLDRRGCVELLQVSPFAKQLGECLIYLDEAHTRGTDLKLPKDYRAAVTLGAHLTKDRLVQACMRMRKLGKGQSVVFCIPEEIQTKIQERTSKPHDTSIEVADVLAWTISETWADLRRSMPLWATQGRRFEEHKHLLNGVDTTKEQAESFQEEEAQTLEHRYRPRSLDHPDTVDVEGWDTSNESIAQIIARCQDFETMKFGSAALQEEQERELAPEIEEERQLERPPPMMAATHELHPDLVRLVESGKILRDSVAFKHAFQALSSTSAARYMDLTQFPTDLVATADFVRTVRPPLGSTAASHVLDSFQRPVQWILSVPGQHPAKVAQNLVVLSPFEANELLPAIRRSSKVTLHLYSPRPNLSHQPLDALDLYTVGRPFTSPQSIPRSLTVQLNLFAGQLYLRSFDEYVSMCDFLGLAWSAAKEGQMVRADGFVVPAAGKWMLRDSPVNFLRVLVTKVRRDCEGVERTHLGKVLDGALLEERDF